jgi:hypothetical protein
MRCELGVGTTDSVRYLTTLGGDKSLNTDFSFFFFIKYLVVILVGDNLRLNYVFNFI